MAESSTVFLHKLLNELPEESKWIVFGDLKFSSQYRIYQLILQLEQDILRKVLVKKGKESEEFKFFSELLNALYQAGEAVHVIDKLNAELSGFKQYNEFLHKQNAELVQEVNRWKTIEELSAGGILEAYINRTREVLAHELKTKKTLNR